MIIFIVSIVIFNFVAYVMKKQLTKIEILLIWEFSMVLEILFDIYMDEKTSGYWYCGKGIDWTNVIAYSVLIPPVCVIFLNWYQLNNYSWLIRVEYFIFWLIFLLVYELLALTPKPWGYFHYGWWKLVYSVLLDPFLLMLLVFYYKWVRKIENELITKNGV